MAKLLPNSTIGGKQIASVEDIENIDIPDPIIQSDTEPVDAEPGDLWLDTSDDFYQATAFESLVQAIDNFVEHIRSDNENAHSILNIAGLQEIINNLESTINNLKYIREDKNEPLIVETRDTDPEGAEVGRMWLRSDI